MMSPKKLSRAVVLAVCVLGSAGALGSVLTIQTPSGATVRIAGLDQAKGLELLERFRSRLQLQSRGERKNEPTSPDDIEYIGPSPLGPGFYLVGSRDRSLYALVDESARNVLVLRQYITYSSPATERGRHFDVLKGLRLEGAALDEAAAASAAVVAASAGSREQVVRLGGQAVALSNSLSFGSKRTPRIRFLFVDGAAPDAADVIRAAATSAEAEDGHQLAVFLTAPGGLGHLYCQQRGSLSATAVLPSLEACPGAAEPTRQNAQLARRLGVPIGKVIDGGAQQVTGQR
jgi:hypothetical protein